MVQWTQLWNLGKKSFTSASKTIFCGSPKPRTNKILVNRKPQRKRALQIEYFLVVSFMLYKYPLPLVKIMDQRIFIDNLTEFYHQSILNSVRSSPVVSKDVCKGCGGTQPSFTDDWTIMVRSAQVSCLKSCPPPALSSAQLPVPFIPSTLLLHTLTFYSYMPSHSTSYHQLYSYFLFQPCYSTHLSATMIHIWRMICYFGSHWKK